MPETPGLSSSFFSRCDSLLEHHVAAILLLFLICVGGCGDRGVEFNSPRFVSAAGRHLIDRFDSAEIWHETPVIDFGSPHARQHLVSGWGQDEGGEAVRSRGVWALGHCSSLEFYLRDARPLELKLGCWIPPASYMIEQGMAIKVNGNAVTRVELQPESDIKQRVKIPETLLQAGLNRLDFIYDHVARPCDVDPESRDARPLAVFWRQLVFGGLEAVDSPSIGPEPDPKILTLPLGTQVSFYESLPPGTELSIGGFDSWARSGSPPGLEILVEADGGPTRRFEIATDPAPDSLTFVLPESPSPWTKLTFRPAGGEDQASRRGGLTILDPVLVIPAPTAVVEEVEPVNHQGVVDRGQVITQYHIVIYLIDCLRADHVGAYGYDRAITPNIDLFASEAVVFENAFAQSSWTRPAVVSLFTGIYPRVHGVQGDLDVLPQDLPYLPEILQNAGYETAAVVTNGMVSQKFGFGRGYTYFERLAEQHRHSPEIHQQSDRLNEVVFDYLARRSEPKPLFLYAHSTDPHAPYLPRQPFLDEFASGVENPEIGRHDRVENLKTLAPQEVDGLRDDLVALYDAEIAFNDAHFGRFLQELKDRGLYDDSVIVLVADHGEQFFEHGRWQHGLDLYQEVLHVPLIVRFPSGRWAGRRVARTVEHIDLLPSLMDFIGLEWPVGIHGHSFLPALRSPDDAQDVRPSFACLARRPDTRQLRSVILGAAKLIFNDVSDRPKDVSEFFDLKEDPLERDNLAGQRPVEAGVLRSLLSRTDASWKKREGVEAVLDKDLEENLRALGYLE